MNQEMNEGFTNTHTKHPEEEKNTSDDTTFSISESRQLTNLELVRKAEDCTDKLKLEKAVSLYDEGIRRFPNDTLILD